MAFRHGGRPWVVMHCNDMTTNPWSPCAAHVGTLSQNLALRSAAPLKGLAN